MWYGNRRRKPSATRFNQAEIFHQHLIRRRRGRSTAFVDDVVAIVILAIAHFIDRLAINAGDGGTLTA